MFNSLEHLDLNYLILITEKQFQTKSYVLKFTNCISNNRRNGSKILASDIIVCVQYIQFKSPPGFLNKKPAPKILALNSIL